MKPEDQRLAIATACGALHHRWGRIVDGNPQCEDCCQFLSEDSSNHCVLAEVPDYLNDLNAMHEAEATLNREQRDVFASELYALLPCDENHGPIFSEPDSGDVMSPSMFQISFAPADQRAEALLRAIGKWVES